MIEVLQLWSFDHRTERKLIWYVTDFLLFFICYIVLLYCCFTMGYSPQIFMPIIDEHHWFLIVFSRKENIFYILDSFPSDTRVSKIESILSILKEQLQESTPGAHYTSEVVRVQRQDNWYSPFTKILFAAFFLRTLLAPIINSALRTSSAVYGF